MMRENIGKFEEPFKEISNFNNSNTGAVDFMLLNVELI